MEKIGALYLVIDQLVYDLGYDLDLVKFDKIQSLVTTDNGKVIRIPAEDATPDGAIIFIRGSRMYVAINKLHRPTRDAITKAINDIDANIPLNAQVYKMHDEVYGDTLNLDFKFHGEFHEFKQYQYKGKYHMTYCSGIGMDYLTIASPIIDIEKLDADLLRDFANSTILKIKESA